MFASGYEALFCRSHGVSQESPLDLRSSIDEIPVFRRTFLSVTQGSPMLLASPFSGAAVLANVNLIPASRPEAFVVPWVYVIR